MATTTNYGWTTPDDTSLVKDGAAAIRTLGSSVDTTTKALNPSTTLGDVEYRSATANTNTRLGIGTTGQVLSVVGGVPAWATVSSGGMTLLSTTTLSGTETVVSGISQSYKILVMRIFGVTNSGSNQQLNIELNSAQENAYSYVINGTVSDVSSARINSYATALGTSANNAWTLEIDRYTSTGYKPFNFYGAWIGADGTSRPAIMMAGANWGTTAISSVKIQTGGNTMTAGTIEIYGVN